MTKKIDSHRKHYSELTKEELEEALDTTIPDLDLPVRIANMLERYGILTVRDVLYLTRDELLDIKNMGVKNVEVILEKLRLFGFYNKHQDVVSELNGIKQ